MPDFSKTSLPQDAPFTRATAPSPSAGPLGAPEANGEARVAELPVPGQVSAAGESTTRIEVEVDVPLVSPNRLMGEHWRSRHHRRKRERTAVARALSGRKPPPGPWHVHVVRLGSRKLDSHDGLPMCAKSVVDEVASFLGIDDRHLRVTYGQEVRRELAPPLMLAPGRPSRARGYRVWTRILIETDSRAALASDAAIGNGKD